MRTADAVTPSLTTGDVALSLAGYVVTYLVIFGGGFVLLRRMVRRGPELAHAREGYEETQTRSARPLSAITHAPTEAAGPGRAFGAARGADDAA
jgi:cytochrome bd ubiquinol oxidase subunit I